MVGQSYLVPITVIVTVEVRWKIAGKHFTTKIEKPVLFQAGVTNKPHAGSNYSSGPAVMA
jgi:hypothetical protein